MFESGDQCKRRLIYSEPDAVGYEFPCGGLYDWVPSASDYHASAFSYARSEIPSPRRYIGKRLDTVDFSYRICKGKEHGYHCFHLFPYGETALFQFKRSFEALCMVDSDFDEPFVVYRFLRRGICFRMKCPGTSERFDFVTSR